MKVASCQGKYINLVYFVYPRWYVIPLKEVVKCRSNNPTTALHMYQGRRNILKSARTSRFGGYNLPPLLEFSIMYLPKVSENKYQGRQIRNRTFQFRVISLRLGQLEYLNFWSILCKYVLFQITKFNSRHMCCQTQK